MSDSVEFDDLPPAVLLKILESDLPEYQQITIRAAWEAVNLDDDEWVLEDLQEVLERLQNTELPEAVAEVPIDSSGRMVLPKTPREDNLGIEGGETVRVTVRVLQRPDDGGED